MYATCGLSGPNATKNKRGTKVANKKSNQMVCEKSAPALEILCFEDSFANAKEDAGDQNPKKSSYQDNDTGHKKGCTNKAKDETYVDNLENTDLSEQSIVLVSINGHSVDGSFSGDEWDDDDDRTVEYPSRHCGNDPFDENATV